MLIQQIGEGLEIYVKTLTWKHNVLGSVGKCFLLIYRVQIQGSHIHLSTTME